MLRGGYVAGSPVPRPKVILLRVEQFYPPSLFTHVVLRVTCGLLDFLPSKSLLWLMLAPSVVN